MNNNDVLHFCIDEIKRETNTAATFFLKNVNGKALEYKAGQFLTLLVKQGDKIVRRSYSICTTPGIEQNIAITIKRKINGSISRYLLDHLHKGDIISSLAPAGRFLLTTGFSKQRDIFLLAAGSGITPVFSLLKKILTEEPLSHVTLLYSNSNEESIIYKNSLDKLSHEHAKEFQCIHIISDPGNKIPGAITGHLNNQLLGELIFSGLQFDPGKAVFMLCGPTAYMRMAQLTLLFMGFTISQIRKENFVVPEEHPGLYLPLVNNTHPFTLHYNRQIYKLETQPQQTILDAALQQHIQLPYSCKGGVCGTCTANCRQGKIVMSYNEVLTDDDIKSGLILTCTGYILSPDAEITFNKS
jgi:ferredoxin-NADP reductase